MSGGGGSGKTTQTSTSYTPEQRKWMSEALSLYGPEMGKGQTSYTGERVAPFTEGQQAALDVIPSYAQAFSLERGMPLFGETGEAIKKTLAGETGAQTITPEQTEAYFKRVFEQPAKYAFEKEILPSVKESFAGPGYWSGARAKAQAEAGENLWSYLGEKRGELDWNTLMANRAAEEARAQRIAGITPAAMAYGQMPTREAMMRLTGGEELYKFASMEQQQQQAEINASIQKFEEGKRLTDPEIMNIMLSLLGTSYQTSITKTSGTSGAGLGSAIGAGAGLLAAAMIPGALTATQALMGAGIGAGIGGVAGPDIF